MRGIIAQSVFTGILERKITSRNEADIQLPCQRANEEWCRGVSALTLLRIEC
jgi:hypothetical protein